MSSPMLSRVGLEPTVRAALGGVANSRMVRQ